MTVDRALVIASGADVEQVRRAGPADRVICADAGLEIALAAELAVDLVVGDLDSVDDAMVAEAVAAGVSVQSHPGDKDESDLELALGAAMASGATEIGVHLASGGRLDHQLANLLVLASPRWRAASVSATVGTDRVWVVHQRRVLPLEVGAPLALHAVGGDAHGVRTVGLRFELVDERLDAMAARGIANIVDRSDPEISLRSGILLAINARTP